MTLTPHIPSSTCPTCGARPDAERSLEASGNSPTVESRSFPCGLMYRAEDRFGEWVVSKELPCILAHEQKRERAELTIIYDACVAVVNASELPDDRKQIVRSDLDRVFIRRSIPWYYPDRYRQKP